MLSAFFKAFEQLGDPAFRRVLWISIGLSLLAFVFVWIGAGFFLAQATFLNIPWLNDVIQVLGGLATAVLSWLLFPAVVSTTTGFFLDGVADAVERRHYPGLPAARSQPLQEMLASTLSLFVALLVLNLLLLVLLLVPPVFPFVFYGANGYLLGREYFETVAARRLGPTEVRALRRQHRGSLFVAGVLIALMLTIPVVNLLVPLVATAAMVHVFETLRHRDSR
ncbi:MAG: EI24 domain-containing protein [Rhodospirillales bacterium]|nr:EI24 domain-containing protein [Rhodospirillales bacterium]